MELQACAIITFNRIAYITNTALYCQSLWDFTSFSHPLAVLNALQSWSAVPLFVTLFPGVEVLRFGALFPSTFFPVLGIKPRALYLPVKYPTTELLIQ